MCDSLSIKYLILWAQIDMQARTDKAKKLILRKTEDEVDAWQKSLAMAVVSELFVLKLKPSGCVKLALG